MRIRACIVIAALWAGACSAEQSGDAPAKPLPEMPAIPAALHGCWFLDEKGDEEIQPYRERVTISSDAMITESDGVGRRVGSVELVQQLTDRMIEGRISAREGDLPITLATTLELRTERDGRETLLRREGDAGSAVYERCSPAQQAEGRYALVIARTGRHRDPVPAPCGPDGSCGDSLFRVAFRDGRVIAGGEVPAAFDARLKLHSPLISDTVLALILERQADGSLLVRRRAGFNGRTGIACFREPDEPAVDWRPEVPEVKYDKGALCVSDPKQIDPNAPKN